MYVLLVLGGVATFGIEVVWDNAFKILLITEESWAKEITTFLCLR